MSGAWSAARGILRFVAAVAATSGALLIADALLTLVWQEPVSAVMAARAQADLERALSPSLPPPGPRADRPIAPERLARLARRYARGTETGEPVGRIAVPSIGASEVVVEGTGVGDLRRGPGHYPGTSMPGAGRTVGVAGHRTTYGAPFRKIDRLRRGDRIEVGVPYGRLTYRVESTRIVPPTALWVVDSRGYDRLVLTACHPLYSAAQRIAVFARLESAVEAREAPPAATAEEGPRPSI